MPDAEDVPSQPSALPSSRSGSGGASEGFAQLVETHYQAAYRFAFSLTAHHDDACDLTQQAFFLAQTHEHQVRDRSKLKQWLFTVLHREFLRMRRRDADHPHCAMEFVEDELPLITVDHAITMDGRSAHALLLTLEANYRLPLALFYFERLSYREIAEVLKIPIGTVMSRLARGKALLRQLLEQQRGADVQKIIRLPQSNAGGLDG